MATGKDVERPKKVISEGVNWGCKIVLSEGSLWATSNMYLSLWLSEKALQSLLESLTSPPYTPTQHLEREQALAKEFAEILHFTLRFDELKVRPCMLWPLRNCTESLLVQVLCNAVGWGIERWVRCGFCPRGTYNVVTICTHGGRSDLRWWFYLEVPYLLNAIRQNLFKCLFFIQSKYTIPMIKTGHIFKQ